MQCRAASIQRCAEQGADRGGLSRLGADAARARDHAAAQASSRPPSPSRARTASGRSMSTHFKSCPRRRRRAACHRADPEPPALHPDGRGSTAFAACGTLHRATRYRSTQRSRRAVARVNLRLSA
jgi:hypothetical protein